MFVSAFSFKDKTITIEDKIYPMKIIGKYDAGSDVWLWGNQIPQFQDDIVFQMEDDVFNEYKKINNVDWATDLMAAHYEHHTARLFHENGFVVFAIQIR